MKGSESNKEMTIEELFAELEAADTTFHIKWSYLSKRYMLTIPWLGLEFEGKSLFDTLRSWHEATQ